MKEAGSWYILRMRKSVYIYTYGCQMNVHDSEKMLGVLAGRGYVAAGTPEDADLIIFNTCAIREKAEQKFFSQLGRTKFLKRKREDVKIVVAGCVAQEEGEKIHRRAPHVDYLLGPQNILALEELVASDRGSALDENLELAFQEFTPRRQNPFHAWVSIMYGCNNFCSYCIVPYTRGREVYRPSRSILDELERLANEGYREVTLLGQNVNSYRSDIDFVELLRKADRLGLSRIRFVTSHPRDLSVDLVDAMAELPSVCEHIHLPMQSGSDRVLRAMNRRYTFGEYEDKARLLKERVPGITITTDIIVGFPGESDEDFVETLRAMKGIGFDGAFAFKFSPRKGTRAFEMDGTVPEDVKAARLTELLRTQDEITLARNLLLQGSLQEVLIEGQSETDRCMLTGRTRTNKIVNFPSREGLMPGTVVPVRITKSRMHSLEGEYIEERSLPNTRL